MKPQVVKSPAVVVEFDVTPPPSSPIDNLPLNAAQSTATDAPKFLRTQEFWKYALEWLVYLHDKQKKERTLSGYRYNLQVFKNWLDNEGVTVPAKQDVRDWFADMGAKGWKVATKNLYLTTVRNFYKWLADERGFENVVAGIENISDKTKEHKHGFLDAEQMRQLIQTVRTVDLRGARKKLYPREERQIELRRARDVAMIYTMLACGLRCVEVGNLRVRDLKRQGGAWILDVLGKGRESTEEVKISGDAVKQIQSWLSARATEKNYTKDAPLFCSVAFATFGKPLTPHAVSNLCKFYLTKAGLKADNIVAHSLRSSCATNAIRNGAKIEDVRQQLRHVNIQTTMIYYHEATVADNPVSDIIGALLNADGQ